MLKREIAICMLATYGAYELGKKICKADITKKYAKLAKEKLNEKLASRKNDACVEAISAEDAKARI